eukprot:921097-Prorocentrum_minimum.AAC.1
MRWLTKVLTVSSTVFVSSNCSTIRSAVAPAVWKRTPPRARVPPPESRDETPAPWSACSGAVCSRSPGLSDRETR